MRGPETSYIAATSIAAFLGGFAFLYGTHFALFDAHWCLVSEKNCVREWVGALSGWAAFVGAILALPYVASQVREARRQTEFAIGDADPEFIIGRNRRTRRTVLTVRNWNRRRIMVDTVTIVRNTNRLAIYDLADADDLSVPTWKQQQYLGERASFGVDGWVDRSQQPPKRRLKILLSKDGEFTEDPDVIGSKMDLEISYRVVGQLHEQRQSTVTTLDIADE